MEKLFAKLAHKIERYIVTYYVGRRYLYYDSIHKQLGRCILVLGILINILIENRRGKYLTSL